MAVIEHVIGDDDAALVLAVQGGDAEAYSILFRRHYPSVRRACARRLRDLNEADEVAQAAFVRAFERIDRCGGERRFGAWVHVIAQRLCIDAIRVRTRTQPQESPVQGGAEVGPNGPEDRVLDLDRAAAMRVALSTLPPRQRDVVVARDVEERRPPEIAAALGLSLGAVDSLLLRARRRLAGAYRAAAGDQGLATPASSAAVAGTTIAASQEGVRDAVMAGVRAVRDAVLQVSTMVTSAPDPANIRRATAAAVAAISLGAGATAVHHRAADTLPVAPSLPPVTTEVVPVPDLPGAPATPSAPDQPDVASIVGSLPSAPTVTTPTVPVTTAPAAPQTLVVEPTAPLVPPVADTVDGVVTAVTGTLDTVVGSLAPVAPAP